MDTTIKGCGAKDATPKASAKAKGKAQAKAKPDSAGGGGGNKGQASLDAGSKNVKICYAFLSGTCTRGAECAFAHLSQKQRDAIARAGSRERKPEDKGNSGNAKSGDKPAGKGKSKGKGN